MKILNTSISNEKIFMMSCKNNYEDIVNKFIKEKININCIDINGYTPLIYAAWNGHLNIVKILINNNANINTKNFNGNTAFLQASENGHLDVIKYFIELNIDFNDKDFFGYTAFILACSNGYLNIVKYFVELNIDINQCNYDGNTGFIFAVSNNHLDIVKYLIEKGADINKQNNDGNTALHTIMYLNYYIEELLPMIKFIYKKININITNNKNYTFLDLLLEYNHLDTYDIIKYSIVHMNGIIKNKYKYNIPIVIHSVNKKIKKELKKYFITGIDNIVYNYIKITNYNETYLYLI